MLRNTVIVLLTCVILVLTTYVSGGPADADPTAGADFVGAKSCKRCHYKQHKTWTKMKHSQAWDLLQPKLEAPDQKDHDGRLCISCHVTGFGQADRGGFKSVEESKHLLGVGCESCHGPGSKHVAAGDVLKKEKRKKFNADEPTFIVLRTTKCANCHNPHHPHG